MIYARYVGHEQYVGGQQLDYNSVFKSSIIGMLRSLDPHSNYYDRDEFDELKTDQRSEYHGIGASIQTYFYGEDGDTYITSTFASSPAERAGLRFGDRIVEVDGVAMVPAPFSFKMRTRSKSATASFSSTQFDVRNWLKVCS